MKVKEREQLLQVLKARFEKNMKRHKGIEWPGVLARLAENAAALKSLAEMEASGGEPDIIGKDKDRYVSTTRRRVG